ncbi:MAG: flagellar basal-body rod protein FlgC [delta proteobacterium MLS_D]|jgi:flagellar basal-body rod protein FlgC|nr:MAG: flagellar basal-body rod protein FlgC [delta proteobacterium MLS_D]
MDFGNTLSISASGFEAQRRKIDVIVENLANMETTRTPGGGPYLRKIALFESAPAEDDFGSVLEDTLHKVKVGGVRRDENAVKHVYNPGHPDADGRGYVAMPDINTVIEMADMIMAHRAYEASVAAFEATKNMALKTLEMGK